MESLGLFDKSFDHKNREETIRRYWSTHQFYKVSENSEKPKYVISMPPPNVTGDLTMGHVLNNTIQDILIRWHRASGYESAWIPGTDHASIATEAKVTKMLEDRGIKKSSLTRDEFLTHAWEWKEKYGNRIEDLLKSLGISCDWDRKVFTMDKNYSRGVIKAIVKLHKEGFVYKASKLVNWCPVSQSVISDEEVFQENKNGTMWFIHYPFTHDSSQGIVIGTTRPETLFGDEAIAVHPDDERYNHLIGKKVIIPVCQREIPIIGDTYVDREFGTGAVKITPAHDMNDFEVGKRHHLPLTNIMNKDASLNHLVPKNYIGLDRYVARKKLIEELKLTGALVEEKVHPMTIGISERGHVPIEYYLSEQWYIKMDALAELALKATREHKLTLIPAFREKIWEHWLTNIKDWCISRQLYWGHRLPIYTCQSCSHIHCEEEKPTSCEKCQNTNLKQENDVLDTWASSWLWPFAVHNWGEDDSLKTNQNLKAFYPNEIVVTGADIIFFWIARMVIAGEHFLNELPFKTAYFTPIIRDKEGRKMSKSLGNSPDVHKLIETYSCDALRFSVINQVVTGQDLFWKDESCDLGRTFMNKIWNSIRFFTLNAKKSNFDITEMTFEKMNPSSDTVLNWIQLEFESLVEKTHKAIKTYEFSDYTNSLYHFMWFQFCDWYLELIKPRLQSGQNVLETLQVSFGILDGFLRLLHPIMPYMTEVIWLELHPQYENKTLGFEALPKPQKQPNRDRVIKTMSEIQSIVSHIRAIRGKLEIHPGTELTVSTAITESVFGEFVPYLENLSKAKFLFRNTDKVFSAPFRLNEQEFFVHLEGLVDREREESRLKTKISKIESVLSALKVKLSQESFTKGAPKHIVEGAYLQKETNEKELELLKDAIKIIESSI